MLRTLFVFIFLALTATAAEVTNTTSYDYIVVGSGPGGGPLAANLARAGHAVLLLEAGDDQADNTNTSMMANFMLATNDEKTRWDFWVKHSENQTREDQYLHMTWRKKDGSFYVGLDPPEGATQLGIWYPRAGTLGGCAMHNGGVAYLPEDDDWNDVVNRTGDKSWEASNMRKYFIKLENNLYLPRGTPGHGFDGYLATSAFSSAYVATQDSDLAHLAQQIGIATKQDSPTMVAEMDRDINAPEQNRDSNIGFYSMALHMNQTGMRTGPNSYIRSTVSAGIYPLTVKINSLVTKVLFSHNTTKPRATGVEVLEGRSVYSADPRSTGSKGHKKTYHAKKEVIVSGGAFNTPQILKLSGIGPAAELARFKIPLVKDLPGVGEKLADNYETGLLSLADHAITGDNGGAYTTLLIKTPTSAGTRHNVFAWCSSFSFEGFWPGMPTDYGPSQYECATVHMYPKSQAGYVRLRSADPTDVPEINFRFFEHDGEQDLTEMLDGVKVLRRAFEAAMTPWTEKHPCPGVGRNCTDGEQKEFIKTQAYSHHPTSTCAIGGDGDLMAVLDSKFRVRGVDGLRVVDASAFPRIPGAFPVLPTMMLSEKATEDILTDA